MREITMIVRCWAPDQLDPAGVCDFIQDILDDHLEHGIKDAEVYLDEGDVNET